MQFHVCSRNVRNYSELLSRIQIQGEYKILNCILRYNHFSWFILYFKQAHFWKILCATVTINSTVGYTDLSGNDLDIWVGVSIVVKSWSLYGVMISTLAQNARDVHLIPALGQIFPIFLATWHCLLWPWSCKMYAVYGCWVYPVYIYIYIYIYVRWLSVCM